MWGLRNATAGRGLAFKPFEPVLLAARIGASLEKKRLHDREAAHLRRIEQQLQIIERERERSDQLLHAILPAPAVAEPRSRAQVTPRRHADVAVLSPTPRGVHRLLRDACARGGGRQPGDRLAHDCEALVSAHGLEKIKTLAVAFSPPATCSSRSPTR
jgi:adenylate cyclase